MLTKTIALGVACAIVLSATLPGAVSAAESGSSQVPAELWDRPRSGRAVISVPAVRHALKSLLDNPGTKLTVRHPPDLEPTLQAEELRAWFVAHALEPARIVLRADLPPRQLLQLEITR